MDNETVNQTQIPRFVLAPPVCHLTHLSLLMKSGRSACDTVHVFTDIFGHGKSSHHEESED